MRSRWIVISAGGMAILTTPLVTWWIVGDQSEAVTDPDYLDSMVEPPSISTDAALALGIVATALLVASVVALLVASRRRAFDPGWWSVLLPLMGAGVIAGFSGRVITAGVIGANIGGGLVVLFGVPIVLALIGWAGVRAGSLTRRRHSEPVGS